MVLRLDDLIEAARDAETRREIERQLAEQGIELPDLGEVTPPPEPPR